MPKSFEPCLCGASDCPRCFPGSYANERDLAWIANYFPGKLCAACALCNTDQDGQLFECKVLNDEADLSECPALEEKECRAAEEHESDRYEARQRTRMGE